MQVPLDHNIKETDDIPYTISYVIRKRQQIDNLNELPKEKRPPESVLWHNDPKKIDEWLEKVLPDDNKSDNPDTAFNFNIKDVEG